MYYIVWEIYWKIFIVNIIDYMYMKGNIKISSKI